MRKFAKHEKINFGKTLSTKIPSDLTKAFEETLKRCGQTKSDVLKIAILEYIKRYSNSEEMRNYAENIQFE